MNTVALQITTNAVPQEASRHRLDGVDFLRGLVMVLMALDHARDFFSPTAWTVDPTDLAQTTPALFVTRWVTHFCAPVFVFLAGASVFLSTKRASSRRDQSRKLVTRGIWLLFLEFTVIRFGIFFDVEYHFVLAQVIWAIGWSMIALAALIHLPTAVVGTISLIIVAGHNVLDGLAPSDFGRWAWVWTALHEGGAIEIAAGHEFFVAYPLMPWVGVMASGYAFGALLVNEEGRRRRLITLGASCCLLFVVLRGVNLYGDPQPWTHQATWLYGVFSFANCEKYPPSLLFLLMTLGPAITLLGVLPRQLSLWMPPIVTFGRVPMFFYILHFYVLHVAAIAVIWTLHGYPAHLIGLVDGGQDMVKSALQAQWGHNLPMSYAAWIGAVLILYPACRWFAGVKKRHRSAWLSYL